MYVEIEDLASDEGEGELVQRTSTRFVRSDRFLFASPHFVETATLAPPGLDASSESVGFWSAA